MKFLVMGAGAIGSVFGGFLARAGHHISLVGRRSHMDAIKEKGLRIKGLWGEHLISNLAPYTGVDQVPRQAFDYVRILPGELSAYLNHRANGGERELPTSGMARLQSFFLRGLCVKIRIVSLFL